MIDRSTSTERVGECGHPLRTDAPKGAKWCKACRRARRAAYSTRPLADDPAFVAVDRKMHELWTWAVGLSGYEKRKWQELESAIFALARAAPRARAAIPIDYDRETHHVCFEQGLHERGDRCHCECADCRVWRGEHRDRMGEEQTGGRHG